LSPREHWTVFEVKKKKAKERMDEQPGSELDQR